MALQEQTLDVMAADGLAQKTDPRRLPLGKSAQAVNLVKNKQGRLEKRLGFTALPTTSDISAVISDGVALSSWNNNLVTVGRLTRATSGSQNGPQPVTALQTFSDDNQVWKNRGHVPEFVVQSDQIFADAPSQAFSVTSIISGDFLMMAWLAYESVPGALNTANIHVWACVKEISTGNFVQPPQIVSGAHARLNCVRLILCGLTAVLLYTDNSGVLYGKSMTVANWSALPFTWVSGGEVTLDSTAASILFDACSVDGDPNNFIVGREKTISTHPWAIVEKWPVSMPLVGGSQTTAQVERMDLSNTPMFIGPFGVRAVSTSTLGNINLVGFVYGWADANSNGVARVDLVTYSTMTPATPTALYTPDPGGGVSAVDKEFLPPAFAVGFSGNIATTPTFIAGWSPNGSTYNADSAAPFYSGSDFFNGTASASHARSNNAHITTVSFTPSGGGVFTYSPITTPGAHLVSKFFEQRGVVYCLGWVPSNTQGTYYVLCADYSSDSLNFTAPYPMRPVAALQTRTANHQMVSPNLTSAPYFDQCMNMQSGLASWSFSGDKYGTVFVTYVATTQGQKTMPALGSLQTFPKKGIQGVQYGTMLALSGGVPTVFDGLNVTEQGYLYVPERVSWNFTAGTGPTFTADGDTVKYIVCYEQFDAQGNFHISGRSATLALTGAQVKAQVGGAYNITKSLILTIPTLGVTMRNYPQGSSRTSYAMQIPPPACNVQIGIYRTAVNGSVFYRVADRFFNQGDASFAALSNTLSATFVQYTDALTDAQLQDGTHPLLYGDGTNGTPGAQDNLCPPASQSIVRHKERLFLTSGNVVYFSKARADLVGPGYQDLTQTFTVGGDDAITGIESMDSSFVALKRNQVFYVGGDGPSDDGANNSFTPPQPVPTDVGCSDNRSVRSTPEGVYFQSDAGLRLLTRSLGIEYAGGPVEDEIKLYRNIVSTTLYPTNNRVIFLLTPDDVNQVGAPSAEFIWRDYTLDAWTTGFLSYTVSESGSTSFPLISSVVAIAPRVAGPTRVLHMLDTKGLVYRENDPDGASAYYDFAPSKLYVSGTWQTPWIKGEDQRRFRNWHIKTLLEPADPHGLVLSIARDYSLSNSISRTWAWSSGAHPIAPSGTAPLPLVQLRTYDGRLVEAVRFTLTDVSDPASITGQGPKVLGLTAGIGVQPGSYKLPAGATQ